MTLHGQLLDHLFIYNTVHFQLNRLLFPLIYAYLFGPI